MEGDKIVKKQYDYYEVRWPYYEIVLYHDGSKVSVERKSSLEMNEYLKQLESDGYTQGYTEEDVEKAREEWEHIYKNRIEQKEKAGRNKATCEPKFRCNKCVYDLYCSKDKDNERKCPDYKRDAPDGGYYG